jgi:hypothetical protein
MIRAEACTGVFFCLLALGSEARSALTPATPREVPRQTVSTRLCFAGRFKVERRAGDRAVMGRFVEAVRSSEGHPNDRELGDVRVVRMHGDTFDPEVGKTYCIILTAGSKQGMTVVAFGPDDAATHQALEGLMTSPSAFENDAAWRKRRALWTKFHKDVGTVEPLIYCEDDALENILYVKPGPGGTSVFLYSATKGAAHQIISARVIRGINRITFHEGTFLAWFSGSIELRVSVDHEG